MGTVKLNREEFIKEARTLSSIEDEIKEMIRGTYSTDDVLRSIQGVNTAGQRISLQNMQSCLNDFSNTLESIKNNFYAAVKKYDASEQRIQGIMDKHESINFNNAAFSVGGTAANFMNLKAGETSNVYSLHSEPNVGQAIKTDSGKLDNAVSQEYKLLINKMTSDLSLFGHVASSYIHICTKTSAGNIKSIGFVKGAVKVGNCIKTFSKNISSLITKAKNWMVSAFNKVTQKIADLANDLNKEFNRIIIDVTKVCKNLPSYVKVLSEKTLKYTMVTVKSILDIYLSARIAESVDVGNLFLGIVKGGAKVFGCPTKEIDNCINKSNKIGHDLAPNKTVYGAWKEIVNVGSYLIPYFGNGRFVFEMLTGVDVESGKELTAKDKIINIASIVGGKALFKYGGKAVKWLAKCDKIKSLSEAGNSFIAALKNSAPKLKAHPEESKIYFVKNCEDFTNDMDKILEVNKSGIPKTFNEISKTLKEGAKSGHLVESIGKAFDKITGDMGKSLNKIRSSINEYIKNIVPNRSLEPAFEGMNSGAGNDIINKIEKDADDKLPDTINKIEKDAEGLDGKDVKIEGVSNPNVTTKTNKMGNLITDYTNPSGNKIRFTEQKPSTIPDAIKAKCEHPKKDGDAIEGKVGKFINEETSAKVTSFGQKVENMTTNKAAGDIDVGTDKYIIEVKKSIKSIHNKQIQKYTDINNINYLNYKGKKIIVYIDEPIDMSNIYNVKTINGLKEKGITVVNSLEKLKGVLK